MTTVVVCGVTAESLHFLRRALSLPTFEVVGVVAAGAGEDLAYRFVTDSAATPFRGTATYADGTLVLAGRHGRGGLRHDHIPVYADLAAALAGPREVDRVVFAEDHEVPAGLAVPAVRLGDGLPDPVSDTVAALVDALGALAPVEHVFVATSGAADPARTDRERLLAGRGGRAGVAVRVGGGPLGPQATTLRPLPEQVVVSAVFVALREPVTAEAVLRRLRAAGRGPLAERLRQDPGPVAAADVAGSPASVLDLGALHVDRATVAFALLTDPLAARARAACAVAAAVPSAV